MILGIDTSTHRLSLALGDSGEVPTSEFYTSQQRHNETLLPLLESLLKKLKRTPQDLTGITVGLGPGSFTGVRIGIATAMGLAQSLHLPVLGISSFLAIAAGIDATHVLVVSDARQGMLYAAAYEKTAHGWQVVLVEQLLRPEELTNRLPKQTFTLAGPEAAMFYPVLTQKIQGLELAPVEKCMPQAERLIQLANKTIVSSISESFEQGGTPLAALLPIYLRRTQAEEMQGKNRPTSCTTN